MDTVNPFTPEMAEEDFELELVCGFTGWTHYRSFF